MKSGASGRYCSHYFAMSDAKGINWSVQENREQKLACSLAITFPKCYMMRSRKILCMNFVTPESTQIPPVVLSTGTPRCNLKDLASSRCQLVFTLLDWIELRWSSSPAVPSSEGNIWQGAFSCLVRNLRSVLYKFGCPWIWLPFWPVRAFEKPS